VITNTEGVVDKQTGPLKIIERINTSLHWQENNKYSISSEVALQGSCNDRMIRYNCCFMTMI